MGSGINANALVDALQEENTRLTAENDRLRKLVADYAKAQNQYTDPVDTKAFEDLRSAGQRIIEEFQWNNR